ncbi:MAG: hypothetical protein GY722_18245 [bacterium]|nr:hypothetical protein [bacterium]
MILEKSRIARGSLLAIATSVLLTLFLGAEREYSSRDRVMAGLAIIFWALGVFLFGLYLARYRRTRASSPISLGFLIGVLPTVLYSCVALLPASLIMSSLAQGVLSIVDALLVPLDTLRSLVDWHDTTYDSHGSAKSLVEAWMANTAANAVLWALVGGLAQAGISVWSKHKLQSHSGESNQKPE